MKLSDLFGKRASTQVVEKAAPFRIMTEFSPYKLFANRRSSATLFVRVKNLTGEPVMSSVVLEVPRSISLDTTGVSKAKEVRLGTLAPEEEKEAKIDVYGDMGTDKGEYTLNLTAFVHYRDYGHVLNAMRKRTLLEAV